MIDLHTHSTESDGVLSPDELVRYVAKKGVTTLALTDHDTVSGLEMAQKTCSEVGINFVPGIEINIDWPTGEFHLLGYGLKSISKEMKELIEVRQKERKRRNLLIIQKMKDEGYDASIEELESMFSVKSLGRPHFAAYMVEKKIVKNRQAAFDKFLARGRPWYEAQTGVSFDEAVVAIKTSGGVPVLAHPLSLYISFGKIKDVLIDLKSRGLEGIEAWHPGVRVVEAERLEKMARECELFVTAGSDFHGKAVRADREAGRTAGNRVIEDRFWLSELMPQLKKCENYNGL